MTARTEARQEAEPKPVDEQSLWRAAHGIVDEQKARALWQSVNRPQPAAASQSCEPNIPK